MGTPESYLKNLLASRARTWSEMQGILDRAERAHRDLTGEEQRAWDRASAQIDEYDEEIERRQAEDTREREAAVAREAWSPIVAPMHTAGGDFDQDDEIRELFHGRGTTYLDVDLGGVAEEKRLIRQGADARELRTYSVGSNAGGGYTVPSTLARRIWDYLELFTSVRQAGPTVITTPSGENLNVPVTLSHGTASLTAEGSAFTEVDSTLGTVQFKAYKYGQIVTINRELLEDEAADLMGYVALDAARAIGRATDVDYTTGVGTTNPQGYLPQVGTAATAQTASTGVPAFNDLLAVQYALAAPYRQLPCAWMMSNKSVQQLRGIKDTTGRAIWSPSYELGSSDTLLGSPVVVSPTIPNFGTAATTRPIVYGHWPSFGIRDVASVRFEASEDRYFELDQRAVRSVLRTDSRILDTHGLVCMLDPTT